MPKIGGGADKKTGWLPWEGENKKKGKDIWGARRKKSRNNVGRVIQGEMKYPQKSFWVPHCAAQPQFS